MKRYLRPLAAAALGGAVGVLAACSSSGSSTGSGPAAGRTAGAPAAAGGTNGGTITTDAGPPPLSADPGLDFTTQGNELYSVVDTPLLTFQRGVQGVGGSKIIPGLAKALPTVTNGGKTYTFFLRSGLHYSNGTAI